MDNIYSIYIYTYILIAIVSFLPECSLLNRCSQQISKNKWLKLQQLPISFKLLKSPTSTFHHRSAYEKEIWEMTAFPSGEPGDGCFAILGSYLDCGSRVRCHYSPLLVACTEAVGGAASDRLWRDDFQTSQLSVEPRECFINFRMKWKRILSLSESQQSLFLFHAGSS